MYQYRCPPQHCQACPKAAQCTSAPDKGRTIKRSEHEDKVEALRQRMHTPEGEALYKKRGQTIEPCFADLKAHRGLRCFASFGRELALIQVGLLVLIHNALGLLKLRQQPTQPAEGLSQDTALTAPVPARSATTAAQPPESHGPLPRPPT